MMNVGTSRKHLEDTNSRICKKCGYEGSSALAIKTHKYHHHGSLSFQCQICFVRFPLKHLLLSHEKSHFNAEGRLNEAAIVLHNQKRQELRLQENLEGSLLLQVTLSPDANQKDALNGNGSDQNRGVRCPICFAQLSSARFLKTHMNRVHDRTTSKLSQHYSQQVAMKSNAIVEVPNYKCNKCNFVTTRMQNYNKHFATHTDILHKCEQCEYTHAKKAEVRRHVRNAHADKTYCCPHCDLKFRTAPILSSHIKYRHSKVYQRICPHCGKTLGHATSLKNHIATLHGEHNILDSERLLCQRCGRVYRSLGAFDSHLERYHSDILLDKLVNEGVQATCEGIMFECRYCNKYKNTSAGQIRRHIQQVHSSDTVRQTLQDSPPQGGGVPTSNTFVPDPVTYEVLYQCTACQKNFPSKQQWSHHGIGCRSRKRTIDVTFEPELISDDEQMEQDDKIYSSKQVFYWQNMPSLANVGVKSVERLKQLPESDCQQPCKSAGKLTTEEIDNPFTTFTHTTDVLNLRQHEDVNNVVGDVKYECDVRCDSAINTNDCIVALQDSVQATGLVEEEVLCFVDDCELLTIETT